MQAGKLSIIRHQLIFTTLMFGGKRQCATVMNWQKCLLGRSGLGRRQAGRGRGPVGPKEREGGTAQGKGGEGGKEGPSLYTLPLLPGLAWPARTDSEKATKRAS